MTATESLKAMLAEKGRGRILADEPLGNYTSFRVGGPAEVLFFPVDAEDLSTALRSARELGVPGFVMGNGTNLLVLDGGIRGLVIHTGDLAGVEERASGGSGGKGGSVGLECLGGTLLSRVINYAVHRGLSGLEFAAGIPGTVGGATWMNAGAHGSSFGDIVLTVDLVTWEGESLRLLREDIEFLYRRSRWPAEGVVAAVSLGLTRSDEASVLEKVKRCLSERGKRLPLGVGMAGSVFKNPEGDFAGRIIEAAGLKGKRIGQAEVSPKHANVIVNLGGATAEDILRLVDDVAAEVEKTTGIALEKEIDVVGEEGTCRP